MQREVSINLMSFNVLVLKFCRANSIFDAGSLYYNCVLIQQTQNKSCIYI